MGLCDGAGLLEDHCVGARAGDLARQPLDVLVAPGVRPRLRKGRDGRNYGVPVSSLRKSADRYSLPRFDGSLRFAVRLPSLGRRFSFFAAGVLYGGRGIREFRRRDCLCNPDAMGFAVDKSIAALAQQSAEVAAILGYAHERLVAAGFC